MATSPYDFAGQMYRLLPEIYRRYDAIRTPPPDIKIADEDRDHGVLRRFLDLPGYQLDQLYSLARAALNLCDLERVNGQLLPLLAQWIGWQTNYALSVAAQRNEIRYAPRLYQTIGSIPTLEATVARVTGWPSRTKEFVYNVARTNQPERLNLWSMSREHVTEPGDLRRQPRRTSPMKVDLRVPASPTAPGYSCTTPTAATAGTSGPSVSWTASGSRANRSSVDQESTNIRRSRCRGTVCGCSGRPTIPSKPPPIGSGGSPFAPAPTTSGRRSSSSADSDTERRLPTAAVDNAGGLWLFWLERTGAQWQVKYNRHDGTGWQLASAAMLAPSAATRRRAWKRTCLCLSTRRAPTSRCGCSGRAASPATRLVRRTGPSHTAARNHSTPMPQTGRPARALPKPGTGDFHDREPAPVMATGGGIELFWSSTRHGGWSDFP